MCDDHLVLDNGITVLRMPYFDARITDLPKFYGHVSRWYLPHTQIQHDGISYPLTVTLMIVDTQKENYVDMGFDWPPLTIGDH